MSDVWDYVILHAVASSIGLVVGIVCGFAAGRASARWSEGRIERFRTMGGAAIVIMAFATMLRVFFATDHQAKCNQSFREGIAARAAAQQAFGVADEQFTDADARWVEDQIKALDASRDRSLTQDQRDKIAEEYRQSLVVKLDSALAKKRALVELDQARQVNPVDNPPSVSDC